MKQYITIEQLDELSKKKKEKLRFWCIEHKVDATPIRKESCLEPALYDMVYLPNIGQMIEFLDEQSNEFEAIMKVGNEWAVDWYWDVDSQEYFNIHSFNELCDALWIEVKKIL